MAVTFPCAVCEKPAATVTTDGEYLEVRGFGGDMWRRLAPDSLDAARKELASEAPNARHLAALDPLAVLFYCHRCDRNYCRTHWKPVPFYDEAGYDGETGTCPNGHEKTIDD